MGLDYTPRPEPAQHRTEAGRMAVLMRFLGMFEGKSKRERAAWPGQSTAKPAREAVLLSGSVVIVREEQVPPFVAVKSFEREERLVTLQAPELAGEFEAALVLRTG
jgi:hypothetical protein